jgi:hypothetical protein
MYIEKIHKFYALSKIVRTSKRKIKEKRKMKHIRVCRTQGVQTKRFLENLQENM